MNILLAYDGSGHAERALDALARLIRTPANVLLVTAVHGMALDAEGNPAEPDPEEVEPVAAHLAAAARRLQGLGDFAVGTRVLTGEPAEVIPQLVHAEQVDLIVTGSHGRGFAGRVVFGSVSEAILHHVRCPVMVVK